MSKQQRFGRQVSAAQSPLGVPIRVTVTGADEIVAEVTRLSRGAGGPLYPPTWYVLAQRGQGFRPHGPFDTLLSPAVLHGRLRPHPYQLAVAQRVLREMAPAAILADEVGLGKTIEAGLIFKELALRDMARSALVLAPKAVLTQWQEELRERFGEEFTLTDARGFSGFDREDRVICSLAQFVSSFDRIAARPWDLLIVDEAHLLANLDSKRRRSAALLRARWRLLLTATPVANKITDLYSLIDLVAPGRLGTRRDFESEFVADPRTCRAVRPERLDQLRMHIGATICRTRRDEAHIAFARRVVTTHSIPATAAEDRLIGDVTTYLRALYRRLPPARISRLTEGGESTPIDGKQNRGTVLREVMALQQSLSSHPRAIEASLRRRAERHPEERATLLALADRCAPVASAKERYLVDTIAGLGREPALVFTLRLDTAVRLRDAVRSAGRSAECYVGALEHGEREALVHRFTSGELDTLIATDAGAEGLNLQQRCHCIVNYDLHWNPMRLEQRIGRVHRLGQTQDVTVHNFALRDTIDEYVLRLLYQKINLFTMTMGALETVLAEIQDGEPDIEEQILDALLRNEDREAVRREMEALGETLVEASERQRMSESLTTGVLG